LYNCETIVIPSFGHCVVCPSSIYGFWLHLKFGIFKRFLTDKSCEVTMAKWRNDDCFTVIQGLSKNGYYYLTFETAIFCRRFDKQFSQVYQLTKNGNFGQLRTVKMESRDNQINLEYFAHNMYVYCMQHQLWFSCILFHDGFLAHERNKYLRTFFFNLCGLIFDLNYLFFS
jgi:hypothetical protein